MKRCPYCGAKNKDQFDYCIRCSASLDEVVKIPSAGSPVSTVISFVVLILVAIVFVGAWQYLKPTEEEMAAGAPPPPSVTAPAPGALRLPRDIDVARAQAAARAGMLAYHQGQYDRAARLFQEFVDNAPENPFAHMYLGFALYQLGDRDQAIRAMEEAFRRAPGNPGFGKYLVSMLMQKEEFTAAEDVVRGYLDVQPRDESARLELIRILHRQGGLEEAVGEGQKLVADDPDNLDAVLVLGACLKDSGQLDEAGKMFEKAVELNPESAVAQHALGVTHVLSGKHRDALEPLETAVDLEPENGLYHLALAQAYESLDYIEDSFAEYEAFLKYSPDDPRAEKIAALLERARKTMKQLEAENKKKGKQRKESVG